MKGSIDYIYGQKLVIHIVTTVTGPGPSIINHNYYLLLHHHFVTVSEQIPKAAAVTSRTATLLNSETEMFTLSVLAS